MNLTSPETETPVSPTRTKKYPQLAPILGIICVVVIAGLAAGLWSYAQLQKQHILPGVSISHVSVGGLSANEASNLVTNALKERWKNGLDIKLDNQTYKLTAPETFLTYDVSQATFTAQALNHEGPLLKRLAIPFISRVRGYNIIPNIQVDENKLKTSLYQTLGDALQPAKDAQLTIHMIDDSRHPTAVSIETEQVGKDVNLDVLIQDIKTMALEDHAEPISLASHMVTPAISSEDIEPLVPQAETWLGHTPLTLLAEDTRISLTPQILASWIQVNTSSRPLMLSLHQENVVKDLRRQAAPFIKPAKDGRIELDVENKTKVFEAPQEGTDIDVQQTTNNLIDGLTSGSSTISIVFTRVSPKILGDGERLGIREVIGIGRSNFSGSPVNRRKNIALGAQKINMTLVPPNEEFSMIKTLGAIDGEHGWLPELVIKGNKTTPEFGGGLCQVGTTMFRAALASGMPITERRNHSYRVRYYEPAGTDATIYDPSPDFKFKNDTANWLLITTRAQDDQLEFTVWGTKDGREVVQTTPRVFNIVAAPPKKIIETLELPPGQEKCTESAHAGADAEFDYTVTYADGNVVKKTFFSRYRPWQAVCLKGVTELSQPAEGGVDQTGVNNPNL